MSPHADFIDYKRALSLLEAFNKLVAESHILAGHFSLGGINYLQSYQATIFADIKRFTQGGAVPNVVHSLAPWQSFKALATQIIFLIASLTSIFYLYFSRGGRIALFSEDVGGGPGDTDGRLESLYSAIQTTEASFFEIFHSIGGKAAIKRLLFRLRPAIYLEAADLLAFVSVHRQKRVWARFAKRLPLQSLSGPERKLYRALIVKYASSVRLSENRLKIFGYLFSLLRPKTLFSIDDPRHYNEVMYAAKKSLVPTYAIQHGHFTKYHVGWIKMTGLDGVVMRPDKIVVWSDYWKDELLHLSTYFLEGDIMIGGNKSLFDDVDRREVGRMIMIPYETDGPKETLAKYVDSFLKCGWKVLFKTRADMSDELQQREYGLQNREGVVVSSNLNPYLSDISIAVGTYSTILYDMVLQGIPVAILKSQIDYGEGMVRRKLADLVEEGNICKRLTDMADMSLEELQNRRNILTGATSQRLHETLSNLIKSHAYMQN